jgi:hypothetical protein
VAFDFQVEVVVAVMAKMPYLVAIASHRLDVNLSVDDSMVESLIFECWLPAP